MKILIKHQLVRNIVVVLTACWLLGCSSDDSVPEPKPFDASIFKKKAVPEKPVLAAKEPATDEDSTDAKAVQDDLIYSYNPIGMRDPFMPLVLKELENNREPRTPLEQYSISQLKVMAIVTGVPIPKALIQAPDGKHYIVRRGDSVGKNFGKIERIKADELVVTEEFRNPEGKMVREELPMRLRIEEEGVQKP